MSQLIARGSPITLDAFYTDGTGTPTDATSPKTSIIDAAGATVVNLDTPTHVGTGHYQYTYAVPADAILGAWAARWFGTVDGNALEDEDGFTVIRAAVVIDPSDGPGPAEGPCLSWIDWGDVLGVCTPATLPGDEDAQVVLQGQILAAATRTMWERSCRQFGLCSITRARVRPVCRHRYTWDASRGYLWRGGAGCGCGSGHFLPMGDAPVASIEGVWQSGELLDPSVYRVDDWNRVVRVDGEPWANTAALDAGQGDPGTVEVSWTYGVDVPADGKMMAALLVCKMAKDVADDCAVPANAERVDREGVTVIINPVKDDTGIALVERWLGNFHCGGASMFDPGARPLFSRTNT